MALAALGFVILIAGILLTRSMADAQGLLRTLPYICVGAGAGLFGGNLGRAIKKHLFRGSPDAARQLRIEAADERNVMINNKAKAKAYDMMVTVYGVLILVLAMLQVDMSVVLISVAAYLFIVFSMVYHLIKYHEEM